MKHTIGSLALLFIIFVAHGQEIVLTPQNESICPGNNFPVSLEARNLNSIGAITLFISADSACMQFDTLTNIHPSFANLKVNDFFIEGKNTIVISWYNIYGVTIDSLNLAQLNFYYKSGNAEISFEATCEITNTALQTIATIYENLEVLPAISVIEEPESSSVFFPESSAFMLSVEGATNYQWQESLDVGNSFFDLPNNDTYSGVSTDSLQILKTTQDMDQRMYRCKLTGNGCTTYSSKVLLTVVLPPYSEFEIDLNQGWNSFSSYLNAGFPAPDSVFFEIIEKIIYLRDGFGNFNFPEQNINSLDFFNSKTGYLIKVSENVSSTFGGYEMTNKILSLNEGWNLIPVLSNGNILIQDLNPIVLTKIIIIKDAIGTNVFWPENNVSTLQVLETGKAYWIKLNAGLSFDFSESNR